VVGGKKTLFGNGLTKSGNNPVGQMTKPSSTGAKLRKRFTRGLVAPERELENDELVFVFARRVHRPLHEIVAEGGQSPT